jgi:predicted TIM-barrel fold metal-dependent hydrolase
LLTQSGLVESPRPFDSCLAPARLIVNGVFEEFPRLKFVASHPGGGI